jgi:zinc transporter ZupT
LLGLGIAEATALAGAASAGQSLLIPVAIAIALANLAAAAGVSGSLRGAPRAPLNVGLRTAAADGMQLVWALLLLVPLATIGQLALALGAGSLLVLATDERLPEALDEGPSPFLSGGTLAGACALAAVLVALGH